MEFHGKESRQNPVKSVHIYSMKFCNFTETYISRSSSSRKKIHRTIITFYRLPNRLTIFLPPLRRWYRNIKLIVRPPHLLMCCRLVLILNIIHQSVVSRLIFNGSCRLLGHGSTTNMKNADAGVAIFLMRLWHRKTMIYCCSIETRTSRTPDTSSRTGLRMR